MIINYVFIMILLLAVYFIYDSFKNYKEEIKNSEEYEKNIAEIQEKISSATMISSMTRKEYLSRKQSEQWGP